MMAVTTRAAALEKLTSDLHDLIFDVQEARSIEQEQTNAREGRRISAAIRRLFDE